MILACFIALLTRPSGDVTCDDGLGNIIIHVTVDLYKYILFIISLDSVEKIVSRWMQAAKCLEDKI
jgi:hypothetical protein